MTDNKNEQRPLESLVVMNIVLILAFLYFKEPWILVASIIFSVICLLSSSLLAFVHKIWSGFFSIVGGINAKILLGIIYFLFLVPIALLKKIFSKKQSASADNFITRDHVYTPDDLKRMG